MQCEINSTLFQHESAVIDKFISDRDEQVRFISDRDEQVRILDMILERVYDSTKVWFFRSYLTQGVASTVAIFRPICHNSYTGVDLI